MTEDNNQYRSFGGFGFDVSEKRIDDLDKKVISYIKEKPGVRILNLGGGRGEKFLSALNFDCIDNFTVIDIFDFSSFYEGWRIKRNFSLEKFRFIQGDFRNLKNIFPENESFDIAVSQRALHYLTFLEAKTVMGFLDKIVFDKIFFSVSGMSAALGENYKGKEVKIEERFFPLEKTNAEKFQIYEPVCLYKEEEIEKILEGTNWKIESLRVSDFGNIKVVVSKR